MSTTSIAPPTAGVGSALVAVPSSVRAGAGEARGGVRGVRARDVDVHPAVAGVVVIVIGFVVVRRGRGAEETTILQVLGAQRTPCGSVPAVHVETTPAGS
jgi:hypothetical protein